MPNDIEAWLAGELPPDERERFEAELARDPALQEEVNRHRELAGHLRGQYLRELVTTVLQDNPPPAGPVALRKKWRFGMLTVGIVLLLSCIWWLYPTFLPLSAPGPAPAPEKNSPAAPGNMSPPPAPAPSEKIREPIAQNRPSPSKPAFENITFTRGGDTLPADLQKLLSILWYTAFDSAATHYPPRFRTAVSALGQRDFPTAFVELNELEKTAPPNDTLSYLKGYCLLELFDGDGAAGYFERLDAPGKPWQAEAMWYSGLGYLLTEDREKAKAAWEKALKLPETVWRKKAREGLRQLKQ